MSTIRKNYNTQIGVGLGLMAFMCATNVAALARQIVNNAPQLSTRPNWLQTCKRSDPNEDKCFHRLFEGCFPALAAGIPEMGIKSFEPLILDEISVSKGSGNLILSGFFQHLVIRGPSNATVRRANLDLNKNTLNFELDIPLLRIRAKYNLRGNILLLPLAGDGDVTMALKGVKTAVYTKIQLHRVPQEVIHIIEMKVTFHVGSMRIHLTNLFNGNRVLGESLNNFLNQNGDVVIAELRPDLEKGLADIFLGLWNNVFSKMPIRLWLL